jgi:glycosyltransferase involved in cell wall biosynthesis
MRFHTRKENQNRPADRNHLLHVVIVAPRIERLIGGQEVQADLLLRLWHDDAAVRTSYVATNLPLPNWLERMPYLRTMGRFPLYLIHLLRGLRGADVVHIFSAAFSSFLVATVPAYCVSRLLQKKVLINYRSGLGGEHLRSSWIARSILRRADGVVVPSAYLAHTFEQFDVSAQAIPNLIDHRRFSYRLRRPLRPLLLCARNLEACYGIDLVLRAFAEVKKAFPEAQLWILGQGSQEVAIRRVITDLKLTGVELPGSVRREQIGRFYDNADILINASRVDNMPASILEAFASGLPVVSTDAGGIPYMVQDEQTGLLCDLGNWRQLAASVLRLLRDSKLACQLTENARQQSYNYGWEVVRLQWLRVYQELQNQGQPP